MTQLLANDKEISHSRRWGSTTTRYRSVLVYAIVLCLNLGVMYQSGRVLSALEVYQGEEQPTLYEDSTAPTTRQLNVETEDTAVAPKKFGLSFKATRHRSSDDKKKDTAKEMSSQGSVKEISGGGRLSRNSTSQPQQSSSQPQPQTHSRSVRIQRRKQEPKDKEARLKEQARLAEQADALAKEDIDFEKEQPQTQTFGGKSQKVHHSSHAVVRRRERDTMPRKHDVHLKQNENRTAIVWVSPYVDDCGATRLKHLLRTVVANNTNNNPNGTTTRITPQNAPRDVWVMHNHGSFEPESKVRQKSSKLLKELKTYARINLGVDLHLMKQYDNKWKYFDSDRSGQGKSSFIRFVAHYNYSWAWHVEDDTFYSGRWHEVFDIDPTTSSSGNATTKNISEPLDVLASGDRAAKDWYHFRDTACMLRVPEEYTEYDRHLNQKRRKKCHKVEPVITRWPIIRVSLNFAKILNYRVPKRWVVGHHEAVVAAVCKVHQLQCSFDGLQPRIGSVVTAGWGKWQNRGRQYLSRHKIAPSSLYHPVKCAAYSAKNVTMLYGHMKY